MAVDYDKLLPSKFVYLPKISQEATFNIKTIASVPTANPKFSFKTREKIMVPELGTEAIVEKDLGYNIQCDLDGNQEGKILSVSNLSAFIQVFKKNNIQDGDVIHVKHVDKGKWEVTKLSAGEPRY
jgi:hypothetical protein